VAYKTDNVLVAARKRISMVFDRYHRIVVSVSSGKDSTSLYHLARDEAERRGRQIEVFFLDQEAEYQSSIDVITEQMSHPGVAPRWFQVPLRMTNATSHRAIWLDAWMENQQWMREKHPLAIHGTGGDHPKRFYDFFPWYEAQSDEPTAFLIGLRSKESLNRFRSVTNNAGVAGLSWSTSGKGKAIRFYPIYDWTFGDVWKFIADGGHRYNRVYDWMFARSGQNMTSMRVSNLIHEKSFKALATLQEFEPDTYERLLQRLGGVHCAALYAADEYVMSAEKRPAAFATWREYRDYLIGSTPGEKMARFTKRFAGQATDEATCQHHVRQILINDWENNVPVLRMKASTLREHWWHRL
jgi:predicted phosphoadenosine phosphosulfate sulfurtransferase